eukprot:tig00000144_g9141.t1
MSNTGKYKDRMPHMRPAGIVTAIADENAATCIKEEAQNRPPTPPEIRKYRRSANLEPGSRYVHYGVAGDPKPLPDNFSYGVKTYKGARAGEVVSGVPKSELQELVEERAEQVYASTKKEPLGRGFSRDYNLPGKVTAPDFKHGRPTKFDESVKYTLYPEDPDEDPEAARELYIKSHGAYEPGEQRDRKYRWPVDKNTHRFGGKDKEDYREGVRKALNPELDDTVPRPSTIVAAPVAAAKMLQHDEVGRCKTLGHGRSVPEDHIFGVPSIRGEQPSAKECLTGYSLADQQPDADLGRSRRFGFRNVTSENRLFGVPSIRGDIPAPRVRSVADTQNYGNEPEAVDLLYPSKYAPIGIHDTDMLKVRAKEELKDIVVAAGIAHADEFDRVFEKARTYDEAGAGARVNVETFRRALLELSA